MIRKLGWLIGLLLLGGLGVYAPGFQFAPVAAAPVEPQFTPPSPLLAPSGRNCGGISRPAAAVPFQFLNPQMTVSPRQGTRVWQQEADFLNGNLVGLALGTEGLYRAAAWSENYPVVTGGESLVSVPSLALDSAENLYLVWEAEQAGVSNIRFSRSNDAGRSWRAAETVLAQPVGQESPSLGVDQKGSLYTIWTDERLGLYNVYFARSDDAGASWSPGRAISPNLGQADQCACRLVVAVDGGLYAAWQDYRSGDPDIYFAYSSDGGQTWQEQPRLNDDPGQVYQGAPTLGVDAAGRVYVAWEDARAGVPAIYVSSRDPQSGQWSANVAVTSPGDGAAATPYLSLDTNGNLYLAWQQVLAAGSEIRISRSDDGGRTWQASTAIAGNSAHKQQARPHLAYASAGILYAAWDALAADGTRDVFFAYSRNQGQTWQAYQRVNDDAGVAGQQSPQLAADDTGQVYAVWEDNRDAAGQPGLYSAVWPDDDRVLSTGSYEAETVSTSRAVLWSTLTWTATETLSSTLQIAVSVAGRDLQGAADTAALTWQPWITLSTSPADLSVLPLSSHLRWRATLSGTQVSTEPVLAAVELNWRPGFPLFLPLVLR